MATLLIVEDDHKTNDAICEYLKPHQPPMLHQQPEQINFLGHDVDFPGAVAVINTRYSHEAIKTVSEDISVYHEHHALCRCCHTWGQAAVSFADF